MKHLRIGVLHVSWPAVLAFALTLSLAGTLLAPIRVYALDVPPRPTTSPVVDTANILSPDEEAMLSKKIQAEQSSTGNQIGILTIPSLQGEALEEYSIKVARSWGIGSKQRGSGVLLLVAVQDRQVRIEVGYGLEGALTDIRSGQIIRDRITPAFRQQQYYNGINAGVDGIITAIHGEKDPDLKPPGSTSHPGGSFPFEAIFFALFFIPMWLGSILARSKSWWAGGVVGAVAGVIVSFFFGLLFTGLLSIIGLALAGLLLDRVVSRNYQRRTAGGFLPSWWAGGSHFGGGGGNSGGFGGFGGGGFGGGGASGDW